MTNPHAAEHLLQHDECTCDPRRHIVLLEQPESQHFAGAGWADRGGRLSGQLVAQQPGVRDGMARPEHDLPSLRPDQVAEEIEQHSYQQWPQLGPLERVG